MIRKQKVDKTTSQMLNFTAKNRTPQLDQHKVTPKVTKTNLFHFANPISQAIKHEKYRT